MKSIGTNEKACVLKQKRKETNENTLVLFKIKKEPTKKHWLYCTKHRNQRKRTGFIAKSIGTNENSIGFIVRKHRNQRESTVLLRQA